MSERRRAYDGEAAPLVVSLDTVTRPGEGYWGYIVVLSDGRRFEGYDSVWVTSERAQKAGMDELDRRGLLPSL